MYDRDVVELALLALEEGMTQAEAAELCGASRAAVSKWASGAVPHRRPEGTISYRTVRKAVDPLDEAERAAYEAAMTENMLLGALCAVVICMLAPGFDVEQEKVRAGREIARGDRAAPPRDHRFLEDLEELL